MILSRVSAILLPHSDHIDRIESRSKQFTSIRDNYVRDRGVPAPGLDLSGFLIDSNDLIGVRVVVLYNSDVDAIRETLLRVYPAAEFDEKLTIHDANRGSRFGYRALHVNFIYPDPIVFATQKLQSVGVEIQVRTLLSDAWARHSHKISYKADNPSDKLLRAITAAAAMLENIDEQIEQIRALPVEPERKSVTEELSWITFYDFINKLLGTAISEDETRAFFLSVNEGKGGDAEAISELTGDAASAWKAFGDIDFRKYGIHDPLTQLKIALYGLSHRKYQTLIPLHMRPRMNDILQIGVRRILQQ
jgi:ppGpp synthetase/RelA/SpoT-type nucleotidyltranferase